jgi:hypothetical protein
VSALSDLIWSLVQEKHAAQKREPKLPLSCSLAIADGGTVADLISSLMHVRQTRIRFLLQTVWPAMAVDNGVSLPLRTANSSRGEAACPEFVG